MLELDFEKLYLRVFNFKMKKGCELRSQVRLVTTIISLKSGAEPKRRQQTNFAILFEWPVNKLSCKAYFNALRDFHSRNPIAENGEETFTSNFCCLPLKQHNLRANFTCYFFIDRTSLNFLIFGNGIV